MKKQTNKTTTSRKTKTSDISNDNSTNETSIDLTAKALENEQKLPSLGLGDTIAKITESLGIEKCEPCEQRRKNFNKMFPWLNYKDYPQLEGEDLELMKRVLSNNIVQNDDAQGTFDLYNKIYKPRPYLKRCMCPGLFRQIIERLMLLIPEEYQKKL